MKQGSYPISELFLHLSASMACMSLKDVDAAKAHFGAAWDIARPDGLIELIGEHHGLLQGLIEACLKSQYPDDFARIIEITYRFSYGWRRIHNPDSGEDVADDLTTTEFTMPCSPVVGGPTPKSHATWEYRRAPSKTAIRRIRKAWHRHTRRAGRAYAALATGLPSASNAFRNPALRSLKLDILALERHYRHGAPSRKIGLFPPIFAGWEPKMLDRRSLLVAGASSLASIMLPRVPGSENAFLLPFAPTEAYADEKDPFRVLVLSRTMFGVVVVDVANKNMPSREPVTLASRYAAGKQLTATTDDEGTAIFEVAPLSEGYVDEATLLDAYDFNGSISISMAGYRDVEIPLARVQGGTAITAPTRPLSDGEPYFRQLTFDEWDIQYAEATFMALRRTTRQTSSPIRTPLPFRHICHRADRQRCASTK